MQSSASPFGRFAGEHHAYFVCRGRSDLLNTSQQNATISVAFQSPLNGEVWWDAEDNRRGVVSRPMARRFRSGEAAGRVHGYRGRQFTLIRRGAGGLPTADKTVDVALVQVWRDHEAILGDDGPPPASSFANKGPDTRFSQKRKNEAIHPSRPHPLAWDRPAHDACFGGPWRRQADVPGDLVRGGLESESRALRVAGSLRCRLQPKRALSGTDGLAARVKRRVEEEAGERRARRTMATEFVAPLSLIHI